MTHLTSRFKIKVTGGQYVLQRNLLVMHGSQFSFTATSGLEICFPFHGKILRFLILQNEDVDRFQLAQTQVQDHRNSIKQTCCNIKVLPFSFPHTLHYFPVSVMSGVLFTLCVKFFSLLSLCMISFSLFCLSCVWHFQHHFNLW